MKSIFIGFGSNKSRRLHQIQTAIKELQKNGDCKLIASSFMYQSRPMHVLNQAQFLNCVCEFQTRLSLEALLNKCKSVETLVGRDMSQASQRYGPREIDLDILFSHNHRATSETLTVPHPLITQREFVLKPLCDIDPLIDLHEDKITVQQHLGNLMQSNASDNTFPGSVLHPYVCLACLDASKAPQILLHDSRSNPLLMGIINMSTDSFSFSLSDKLMFKSDKSQFDSFQLQNALTLVEDGASIIDIGGESTRPGSEYVSDNIVRISGLHNDDTAAATTDQAISQGGASVINYVFGGRPDSSSEMLQIAAKHQVPIILNHSRGTPMTMPKLNQYGRTEEDLIEIVCSEIESGVAKALQCGVLKWNIIIDPGLGFAKNPSQSLCIIKNLPIIRKRFHNYPLLIGASRKGFTVTSSSSSDVKDRDVASAVLASISVMHGADIIRTHNIGLTKQAVEIGTKIRFNNLN